MPIDFTCPHCGHRTNVDDRYAGQTGPCASCGKIITVPHSGAAPLHLPPGRPAPGPTLGVVLAVAAVAVLVCGGIVALFLPALGGANVAARRSQCVNNLKQIGLAMHNYHDTYKCFPPAVITDKDGQPMRSWRIAVLPFMESTPLCDQYDFDEPWDAPSNRALHGARPLAYVCPSDSPTGPFDTSYVMIVGKGTLGGVPNEAVRFPDITDGTANTILAIEVAQSGINWLEPRDMTVDEAVAYITDPGASGGRHAHPGGVNVLFADGSVRFLSESLDPQTLRLLMTRDDGQALPAF